MNPNEKEILTQSLEDLRNGQVLLCPTDTIVGLSCDATNEDSIRRIAALKNRPVEKSFIVLVSSFTMLEAYAMDIPESAYQLMEVSDKPVTIVYPHVRNVPAALLAEDGSLGIRMVTSGFTHHLIQRFRKPIVSTSANLSGEPAPATRHEVASEILDGVDYIVPLDGHGASASSIVKFSADNSFQIIRK